MNRRIFVLVCLLVAGISAGVAWRGAGSIRAADAEQTGFTAKNTELQTSLRQVLEQATAAESREHELKLALEAARAKLEAARRSAPSAIAREKDAKGGDTGRLSPQQAIANDPTLQALSLAARRATLERAYGPLFRSLGLRAAEAEKFCAILIRSDEQAQDLAISIQTGRLSAKDPAVASFRRKGEEELRAAQQELLGPAGFAQLQEYNRVRDAREAVQKFAGAAALADVPMTDDQAKRLTEAFAAASESYQKGGRVDWRRLNWTVADANIAAVLSPAQLALFQRIEPLGGGISRWMGILDQRMDLARQGNTAGANP